MPDIGLLQGATPRHLIPPPVLQTQMLPGVEMSSRPVADLAVSLAAPTPPATPVGEGTRPNATAPPPIRVSDLLWLGLALIIIIGTGIGSRDPWPADEPRFAAIARDMVATGEWLFPRVGGDLYQDKPPMFFWMLAVCYSLIGSIKWSFLLPAFLSAGGVLFLVYDLGRRLVSREAGLAAALITVTTAHFAVTMRGAQIDPVLCFLSTFSLYALLRHLLLGPAWGWYVVGGFAAGLGVITKGVGFLPLLVLLPYFLMRISGWHDLVRSDGGKFGWRWWLVVDAAIVAVSLWLVPMLIAVSTSGAPEYVAYRDEILFKQTVGRYTAAWHHVQPWYYFIFEVIPALWMPWSLLLVWLVPRFKAAFHARDARVWLPLSWALMVLIFFSISPGKRGVYILPALPALAIASLPFIEQVLARAGVRRAGLILAGVFFIAAAALASAHAFGAKFVVELIASANLPNAAALYIYLLLCGIGIAYAIARAPLAAWPVALGSLTLVFSCLIAPAMNPNKSGSAFVHSVIKQVTADEELALMAYKEQYLLYPDRPIVNFGHRRWLEGPHESYDASAWLNAAPRRVLLVPADKLQPCFPTNAALAGHSSGELWYLVRGPASQDCVRQGDANRAIHYAYKRR